MEITQLLYHFGATAAVTVILQMPVVMELSESGQYPVTERLVAPNGSLETAERCLTNDTYAMKMYRQRSISEK